MSDMSLFPVDGEGVGQQFDGVQFSADSSISLATMHEVGGGEGRTTKLMGAWQEFHLRPSAVLRFMQHLVAYPDLSSVMTRWGRGTINIDPKENHLNVNLDIQRVADEPQEKLQLIMAASFDPLPEDPLEAVGKVLKDNRVYTINAELIYTSAAQFAVRQFAQMATSKDGKFGNTTGMAATAIAYGLEALERTVKLDHQGEDALVWRLLKQSLSTDGITPTTALLAANLVPGQKVIPPTIAAECEYTVETLQRSKAYDVQGPTCSDEPLATVSFVPWGGHSYIFDDEVTHPTLEVRQTVPMTLSGIQQPYSSIVTGGLIAASKMGKMFPLAQVRRIG